MCCMTKRKIADCVKNLVCQKDIRKITIQDIMYETHMSRQSFYYHFKDIYDVLEWIGIHDFAGRIECRENETLESWMMQFIDVINADQIFCERLVREVHWPKLLAYIRRPIEAGLAQIISRGGLTHPGSHGTEPRYSLEFFTTFFCYYLMDYAYHRKEASSEQLLQELGFIVSMLDGPQMVRKESLAQKTGVAV